MSATTDLNYLVKKISALEGNKHQASNGDIKEILKITAELYLKDEDFKNTLYSYINEKEAKIKK